MFIERFFIFFLSCFIFVEAKPLMSVSQDLNIILSCNSTSSVNKRTLNMALIENRFDTDIDENFKCFLHCLYYKYNWMDKNGFFLYNEMRSSLLESNLDESSIEYLLMTCTEAEVKDKCERAYFFTECFWIEIEKLENHCFKVFKILTLTQIQKFSVMISKNKSSLSEKMYILEGDKVENQQGFNSLESSFGSDDTRELLDSDRNELHSSSLSYASFNYINSIIGSGVIGIPYAFQQAGFGLGFLLLILVAVITDYSLVLMIRSGHLAGMFSYQGVMEAAFGRPGFLLLSILQFIYPFIAMVSYNVVVGDTVTKVLVRLLKLESTSFFSQREVVTGLATVFVTLPLCLYKDITKLAKVSLFSLVCVGFILLVVIAEFFMLYDIVPTSNDSWRFLNWNVIPAIGIMTFAFMCHHNTFLIYGSIKNADQRKWDSVTHISLTVSFLIATLFGVVGYATFTGYSQGDLLENYCPDDDLISAARIFFSITILLTYPIECFVAREIIENSIFSHFGNFNSLTQSKHFYITLFLVTITYLLSLATDCLGIVLELNGVLAAVPLAYILPALCYLKLEPSPIMSKVKLLPLSLFVVGVVVAVFGLLFVVNDYKTLGNCSHGRIMDYCTNNSTVIT